MVYLGNLYVTGSGLKLDKKKAERLFRMAADRGDAFDKTRRVALGPGVVVGGAFLSPTFAVWCLAFLNAKPARRKDAAAEGGMEIDMSAML
ncbi:hypothetical protein SO694_000253107 [Aureococcus anophagefferens]|uniref:Uncharacterized protein n=1 Tax=Aureococcus anophagefferens TaxID=44056 RepID=A0ABR1FVG8_AURAN